MAAKDEVDVAGDNKEGQQQASEGETPKQAAQNERQAVWGDYFRVFTYAKKWDFALMFGAAVASLAAGVVSPQSPIGAQVPYSRSEADVTGRPRLS
jgi:hypothetical protein